MMTRLEQYLRAFDLDEVHIIENADDNLFSIVMYAPFLTKEEFVRWCFEEYGDTNDEYDA